MPNRLPLLLAYLAFVVYGSLVPLEFRALSWDEAWTRFRALPFLDLGVASRADWVANGVLYVPLGVLAAQVFTRWLGGWAGPPLAWLLCMAVAVGVEFTQLFFAPRTASLNDLLAEGLGAGLGVAAAPYVHAWGERLAASARRHRMLWLLGLLQVYAVLYLAMAFFPYDLLISAQEWRGKLAGSNVTWGLITDRGWGLALLRLAVEAALVAPLGVLVACLAGWTGWRALWLGAAAGLLLGALLEAGQLALASGVSQGASVLSRGLGAGLGAALAVPLLTLRLPVLRRVASRWGAWALPPYLALLLFASGWMRGAWHGLEPALATLESLRWVPFYYHYYTTEAIALYSLGVVVVMYAPLAALAWARGWRAATTVAALLLLVGVVEAGKLFVAGQRPDPTNLLIVAATAWLVWQGLQALASPASPAVPVLPEAAGHAPSRAPAPVPAASARAVLPLPSAAALPALSAAPAVALAVLCLGAVALGVALMPAGGAVLAAVCAAAALAVWWRPVLAVVVVLAAMPLLDLAPWTGPRWFNEFDLLLLLCLGLAGLRLATGVPPPRVAAPGPAAVGLPGLWGLWALSLLAGAALTLWAVGAGVWPGHSAWHSGWAALALVKAALWAWALVGLLRQLDSQGRDWVPAVAAGMQTGLAGVVLWVLWERYIFVGWTDFAADYRVTGPFSAMHRGGAFIECYLATASAFAVHGLWHARRWWLRLLYLALLAGAGYAVMVTFSRNGYAAFALVLLLGLAAAARGSARGRREVLAASAPPAGGATAPAGPGPARARLVWALAGVLAVAAVAAPVLSGGFARERLAASRADLDVRLAHWRDAIAMRSPGVLPALLGEGLGRFPELHFWRSTEPRRAASFQRLTDGSGPFLRLGPGSTLYLEQVLRLPDAGPLQLEVDLRSRTPGAALDVALCEKSTLTSARCVVGQAAAPPEAPAERWHTVRLPLVVQQLDAPPPPWGPQLKFSLLTPGDEATLDVARVRLTAADGQALLVNGDFARGTQRWAWATDVDPPWHVHQLAVHVWLEQGWLGAMAWALLLVGALAAGAALAWQGQARLAVAWAALAGFVASGLLNTLVDEPRFLWLLLLLVWWALQRRADPIHPAAQRARR